LERASGNGGAVCADSVAVLDSFCVMCSRGVAGGDGKSISKCYSKWTSKRRRRKKITDKSSQKRKKIEQTTQANFTLDIQSDRQI
jgi:hypothetical protein